MTTDALIPSVSIAGLTASRDAVLQKCLDALALLREAEDLATARDLGFPEVTLREPFGRQRKSHLCGSWRCPAHDVADLATRVIDARAWALLFDESGMRSFMDATARKQWNDRIRCYEVPPLTEDNIRATFGALYEQRGELFERGIVQLFRQLAWNYKTNQPFLLGRRIVLRGVLQNHGRPGRPRLSVQTNGADRLDDLERVMSMLDGKPQPDHRFGWLHRLERLHRDRAGQADADYFRLRWFLNGNAHLTFLRPDMVEAMNRIIAKHHPGQLAYAPQT